MDQRRERRGVARSSGQTTRPAMTVMLPQACPPAPRPVHPLRRSSTMAHRDADSFPVLAGAPSAGTPPPAGTPPGRGSTQVVGATGQESDFGRFAPLLLLGAPSTYRAGESTLDERGSWGSEEAGARLGPPESPHRASRPSCPVQPNNCKIARVCAACAARAAARGRSRAARRGRPPALRVPGGRSLLRDDAVADAGLGHDELRGAPEGSAAASLRRSRET